MEGASEISLAIRANGGVSCRATVACSTFRCSWQWFVSAARAGRAREAALCACSLTRAPPEVRSRVRRATRALQAQRLSAILLLKVARARRGHEIRCRGIAAFARALFRAACADRDRVRRIFLVVPA